MAEKNKHKSIQVHIHQIISGFKYRMVFDGILVGFLTGAVVSVFRKILSYADDFRSIVIREAHDSTGMLITALLILAALTAITVLMYRKEPMISGSGIPQVKAELMGFIRPHWRKTLICKFIGGICAITGGLSLGREGPSIQLGAMVGKGVSNISADLKKNKNLLMTCGAGAGLAAAFSAPLAGVIFSMEELQKRYSTELMLSTMASSIVADWVASYAFGLKPVFDLTVTGSVPVSRYWEILILGLILGFAGSIYNKCIELSQNLFEKLGGKGKVIVPFVLIIMLAIWYPQVLGSGHGLVAFASLGNHGMKVMLTLLLIKFAFSILSFGTGAPGGIFLPLLVLGAIIGGTFSEGMGTICGFSENYISMFVVMGMAGLFGSIVRAPLTGIVLISEMTGIFSNLLPLAIVSFVANMTAEFNYSLPIYDQLMRRMLSKKGIDYGEMRHSRAR